MDISFLNPETFLRITVHTTILESWVMIRFCLKNASYLRVKTAAPCFIIIVHKVRLHDKFIYICNKSCRGLRALLTVILLHCCIIYAKATTESHQTGFQQTHKLRNTSRYLLLTCDASRNCSDLQIVLIDGM